MVPLSLPKRGAESIRSQLISVLKEMEDKDPEIEGAVIIRTDGLVLASALPREIDRDLASAMSASVLSVSQRVLQELKRGNIINTIIRGNNGIIMIIPIMKEIVLAAIGKREANLGLMLVEMRRAADKVKEIIERI